ncbi:MAG: type II toxin-antitoxin system VapC family toxin [Candidatus Promineifilaceae bacterium]|nr:type II toxin-antitoxin system VapC family toxin [Candidatus Promineifilaceae bacterium]
MRSVEASPADMIAVDTNVLVRLLTGDDQRQYEMAYTLFEEEEIFIPRTVILEAAGVLRHAYLFYPAQIVAALTRLAGLPNVTVESARQVADALRWHADGVDFVDALHLAASQHAE